MTLTCTSPFSPCCSSSSTVAGLRSNKFFPTICEYVKQTCEFIFLVRDSTRVALHDSSSLVCHVSLGHTSVKAHCCLIGSCLEACRGAFVLFLQKYNLVLDFFIPQVCYTTKYIYADIFHGRCVLQFHRDRVTYANVCNLHDCIFKNSSTYLSSTKCRDKIGSNKPKTHTVLMLQYKIGTQM